MLSNCSSILERKQKFINFIFFLFYYISTFHNSYFVYFIYSVYLLYACVYVDESCLLRICTFSSYYKQRPKRLYESVRVYPTGGAFTNGSVTWGDHAPAAGAANQASSPSDRTEPNLPTICRGGMALNIKSSVKCIKMKILILDTKQKFDRPCAQRRV